MARQTKRGICELCGSHTNVGMNHGSAACPACTHVQTALNKRPEAVAKAIRAMHKTEEMLSALIPAGGLAVKVTADLLQEISGIVDYRGEDPAELVEAVRRRVLTCASCEAEDVLAEIRQVIGYVPEQGGSGLADAGYVPEQGGAGYVPEQGDGGLVDAVRQLVAWPSVDCGKCATLRGDLLRACGLEMDDTEDGEGWDVAAAAAIQTIAELLNIQNDLTAIILRAHETIDNLRNEISRLNGKTHSESAEMTELSADLEGSEREIVRIRSQLTLAQQSRDEWEQRAVQAESNVETLESELRNREDAPAAPCASTTYLLDIALRALRGEGPDADQLATLLDAARRAA